MSSQAWQIKPFVGFSLTHPRELEAWIAEAKRNGGNILEIGTFQGVSAAHVATECDNVIVYSVDTLKGMHTGHMLGDAYQLNRRGNMCLWVGTLASLVYGVGFPSNVATAWVDGGHTYDDCKLDLDKIARQASVKSILVHDYTAACFAYDIPRACDDVLTSDKWENVRTVETTAIFRRR